MYLQKMYINSAYIQELSFCVHSVSNTDVSC